MFSHETTYRVCYADTDQMGYVYYGHYARLYEIGRVEALRWLGLSYKALEASGVMMPVYELKCRYHAPAKYDDLLRIKTYIRTKPKARIVFDFEVFNEQGQLLNTGEATLVFVKMDSNRLTTTPPQILNALHPFLTEA
jgi:acyl-CoA thioester hydrolase